MRPDVELLVTTYRRAGQLRSTLEALAGSPFSDRRITVLDNASPDETPAVCAEFDGAFADLRVVRHSLNIGGGANYMRAVEIATATYTWILADDDDLDFSHCEDVLAVIAEERADLISVGAPGRRVQDAGRTTTAGELADGGGRYFWIFSFIPNTIFRTDRFDDHCIERGYFSMGDLYPQFEFLRRELERDASVYFSQTEIVRRRGLTTPLSELYWFTAWVNNCATLEPSARRRTAIREIAERRQDLVKYLALAVANERIDHPEQVWRLLGSLLTSTEGTDRAAVAALATLALPPRSTLARLRALARRRSGPGAVVDPERFTTLA